ncbi:MAG: signal peptidase II [Clostridiales bacterium]|nr:signal peptidase II [Clostridiales bacterium]
MQIRRGIALEARRPVALFGAVAAAVLAIDQLTKYVIRAILDPAQSIPLIEGVFHLTYIRNTGAAFGLMPGQRSLFITTTVLVLAAIGVYCWRARPSGLVLVSSLALVTGGAIGNLIDRVVAGRVTDFFDFRNFPVFNIADTALVTGAAGLFVWALLAPIDEREDHAEGDQPQGSPDHPGDGLVEETGTSGEPDR